MPATPKKIGLRDRSLSACVGRHERMRRIGRLRPFIAHSCHAESYLGVAVLGMELGVAVLGVGVLHPKQVPLRTEPTLSLDTLTGATQRP